MLDSKDTLYIIQIFDLIDIIMKKVPEKFIVHFLREGVIDNITSILNCEAESFYIPEERSNLQSRFSSLNQDDPEFIELDNEINKTLLGHVDPEKRNEIKKTMLELLKKRGKLTQSSAAYESKITGISESLIINKPVETKKNIINEDEINEDENELKFEISENKIVQLLEKEVGGNKINTEVKNIEEKPA